MFKNLFLAAVLALSLIASHAIAADSVRIYPAPAGEPLATNFTVTVDENQIPVYRATVATADPAKRSLISKPNNTSFADTTAFASFDLSGRAEVTVTCPQIITNAVISPASRGITPVVSRNTLSFTVSKPGALEIDVNGDWVHSLQLFVNPPDTDAPRPDDPNVIYFGPGVHQISDLVVSSGKTVYLAGGAVVYGKLPADNDGHPLPNYSTNAVLALNGNNITLRGRGILDGSLCPRHTRNLISVCGTNITLEGIVVRDSSTWTLPIRKSEHVTVKNLKIFGWRGNSDGVDICNSRHVTVTGCFLRTMDDLVVVKTLIRGGGESRDITVTKCVLWNELAHALSIGAELRENVYDVRFSDCDVIHDKGREWLLRVYHCDDADIHDITFDHIRADECKRLAALWIGKAVWSKGSDRGHIENITFRDIRVKGPKQTVDLKGFDAQHTIHDIRFQNVTVNGQPLAATAIHQNEFVQDVSVKP